MSKHIYRGGRMALALAAVLVLIACAKPTPPPETVVLKLNWLHGSQFLGFYVADGLGFYAEEGLAVDIMPRLDIADVYLTAEQVASDEIDFGQGTLPLVDAQAQGVPVVAIAGIYRFGPGAFFARADSGIVTPADLAGRSVVVKTDVWRELLAKLLEQGGLTLADVEETPGGFDMAPFFEGEVEVWAGFVTNEVVLAREQGIDLVTFPLYEYGIHVTAATLYMSQAALSEDPGRAARFLRASLRGWEWAVENPVEAVDVMLERFPEMPDERDFHLASFAASIPLIRPPGMRIGEIDCREWVTHKALSGLASTEGLCTTAVLEAARQDG